MKDIQNNFSLKREVETVTKPAPKTRLDRIKDLMRKLKTKQESKKEIEKWNASISEEFLTVEATVLQDELLHFGDVGFFTSGHRGPKLDTNHYLLSVFRARVAMDTRTGVTSSRAFLT